MIMGYVKTSDNVIDELLATSGTLGGLFVKPLRADEGRSAKFYELPVEWYTKGDGEKAYDYYCRVRADAIKKSKPMTSRRGHGNALGVVGSEEAMKQKKRKRWVAQGVPDDWNPTTIERWLQSQGWTGVDALSAPPWRGQGWLFTGGQPISLDGGGEGPVCYEFDNFQILVRQWVPARMQTRGQSIDVRPCWFQTTKEDPKKDQTKKREAGEEPKAAEKGALQVDSTGKAATDDDASADTKKMRTNDGEAKGTKTVDGKGATPVPERRWGETTGNTQHREQFKWPTKGPMGLKMMELGGTGDCGLRSLAYAKARLVNAKEPKEEAMAKAVKRSISTRTMIYEAFKKDKGWREGWAPSPEATFTTEGGKPATNAEEYLEAVKRPTKWLDWRMVDKAAKVLGRDVLLYSTENKPNNWTLVGRATADESGDFDKTCFPIVLCHHRDHFRALDDPPSKEFKDALPAKGMNAWRGHGGSGRDALPGHREYEWTCPVCELTMKVAGNTRGRWWRFKHMRDEHGRRDVPRDPEAWNRVVTELRERRTKEDNPHRNFVEGKRKQSRNRLEESKAEGKHDHDCVLLSEHGVPYHEWQLGGPWMCKSACAQARPGGWRTRSASSRSASCG